MTGGPGSGSGRQQSTILPILAGLRRQSGGHAPVSGQTPNELIRNGDTHGQPRRAGQFADHSDREVFHV
jgi:predicted ABC-type transport system involved in lysophospholipase L1 biosynthesis ATPase subunit